MNVNSFFSFYTYFSSCYNLIIILSTLDYAHLEALPFTLMHVVSVQCRIITPVTVCLLQLPFTKYKTQECRMFCFERLFAPEHFALICICADQGVFFFWGGGDTRGAFIRGSSMSVLSKFTISKKNFFIH